MTPIVLPESAALASLLDFTTILENAAAKVFQAAGLSTVTSSGVAIATAQSPAPVEGQANFQVPIPRVEVKVDVGPGTKQGFAPAVVNGRTVPMCATFQGTLTVQAITAATKEGKQTHSQYRALVLYICNLLGTLINDKCYGLTMHKVHSPVTQTGMKSTFKTSDGFECSEQTYNFDFSILPAKLQSVAT